ncbi:hypothetical protein B5M42_014740 [Paenibacillus athensensis]|uniref:Uncharacterized protein n=1 Tax=Paenibacillus athensensis TaxID=1967502 RepID=A0A4Y8Q9K3_9BACL|nr:hypothetical protein [Paenibacillus athensensis]MCD1260069.1 hypothetical protein [Paenibacillus athensensis]
MTLTRAELKKVLVVEKILGGHMASREEATELARTVFQTPVWVKCLVGNFGLSFPDTSLHDREMSLTDYFGSQRTDVTIEVYVDSDSDIDSSLETDAVKQVADQCMAVGMKDGYIDIFYLRAAVKVSMGKLQQSVDDSQNNFRKK